MIIEFCQIGHDLFHIISDLFQHVGLQSAWTLQKLIKSFLFYKTLVFHCRLTVFLIVFLQKYLKVGPTSTTLTRTVIYFSMWATNCLDSASSWQKDSVIPNKKTQLCYDVTYGFYCERVSKIKVILYVWTRSLSYFKSFVSSWRTPSCLNFAQPR